MCQYNKYQATAPTGLLQPIHIPKIIWDDISLDFITELPCSQGYEVILVVVDRLSKYAHFIALKHLYTARMVAEAFIKNVTKLHRFLKSIISDKDTFFSVNFGVIYFAFKEQFCTWAPPITRGRMTK